MRRNLVVLGFWLTPLLREAALVEEALRAGAYGAKLTGAGFGGAVVALVAESRFPAFREALARRFPDLKVL